MSGFMLVSGEETPFSMELGTGYSRSRSNTIHGAMHSALRGAEPPVRYQTAPIPTPNLQDDRNSGTARSPKLFLDCVGIRRRSQSLSYGNSQQVNIFDSKARNSTFSGNPGDRTSDQDSPENSSPEMLISSTFPPRRDFKPKNEPLTPHPMTQSHGISSAYHESSDSDMDTDDDAMETEDSYDEDEIHFGGRSKKHVSWPEERNLVIVHTYKSDKRYYEKNPFYGYGKIEYSSDEDEVVY